MTPKFPAVIDSTMRADFKSCAQKFAYAYIHNLRTPHLNINLHFGAAFASGTEHVRKRFYTESATKDEALITCFNHLTLAWGPLDPPDGETKTFAKCFEALVCYFDRYDPATDPVQPYQLPDGSFAIESSFALETPIQHPETGDPILYAGRYDMLGVYSGQLFVVDEKTPRQLGATWANQWPLRSQFTGYCAAAFCYGHPVVGAITRGVGIRKNDIGFAEHISLRPRWQIDRWWDQLCRDLASMVDMYESGHWDLALESTACAAYSDPCAYADLCLSLYPSRLIEQNYKRIVWNPILRTEEEL